MMDEPSFIALDIIVLGKWPKRKNSTKDYAAAATGAYNDHDDDPEKHYICLASASQARQ